MQLLFIEGVSGVGKTTTAQRLCDQLRARVFSVDCYLEFDFANPIDFYCTAYFHQDEYATLLKNHTHLSADIRANTIAAGAARLVRYYNQETPLFLEPLLSTLCEHEFCWNPIHLVSLAEYTSVYKTVWEQFAKSQTSFPNYVIFDGSLLHHPLNDMMRNYHASIEQAAAHVNTLLECVMPLRPQIIYLSSDNIATQLVLARKTRQQPPPTTNQIRFWKKRKQMDDEIIQQISIPYVVYDVSQGDWNTALEAMVAQIAEPSGP